VVRKFLQALPSCFEQIASSIETLLNLDDVSVEELIGRLKAMEEWHNLSGSNSTASLNLTEDELGRTPVVAAAADRRRWRQLEQWWLGHRRLETQEGVAIVKQQTGPWLWSWWFQQRTPRRKVRPQWRRRRRQRVPILQQEGALGPRVPL
jgi:hypothetical protein